MPAKTADTPTGTTPLTVSELILAYFKVAQPLYVKHGEPTSEQGCLKQTLRPVRQLYGTTPATAFRPHALKNVRQALIDAGRARGSIDKDAHRIERMFRWAVEEELLAPDVHQKLRAVAPLAKGKTTARETGKVPPVPVEHVAAVLPHPHADPARRVQSRDRRTGAGAAEDRAGAGRARPAHPRTPAPRPDRDPGAVWRVRLGRSRGDRSGLLTSGRPRVINLAPTSLDGVFDALRLVASAACLPPGRAEEVVGQLRRRIDAVATRSERMTERPRVVVLE